MEEWGYEINDSCAEIGCAVYVYELSRRWVLSCRSSQDLTFPYATGHHPARSHDDSIRGRTCHCCLGMQLLVLDGLVHKDSEFPSPVLGGFVTSRIWPSE